MNLLELHALRRHCLLLFCFVIGLEQYTDGNNVTKDVKVSKEEIGMQGRYWTQLPTSFHFSGLLTWTCPDQYCILKNK